MIENLKYFKFYNLTIKMHFYNPHILVLFLYYIIGWLSIILIIIENINGLPFCFNLSAIFINLSKKIEFFILFAIQKNIKNY